MTRGYGAPGLDPARCERSSLVVTAYPFPPLLGSDPISVIISSIQRKAPRSVGAHVKSLNYVDAVLAKRQANAAGAGDAVMLDHLGAVAECTAANIFAVVGGTLRDADRSARRLPGVTRRTILEVARGASASRTRCGDLWPGELYPRPTRCSLTGSGAGIVLDRPRSTAAAVRDRRGSTSSPLLWPTATGPARATRASCVPVRERIAR